MRIGARLHPNLPLVLAFLFIRGLFDREQEAGTLAFQLYSGSKGSLSKDEALDALRAMGCAPTRAEVSGTKLFNPVDSSTLYTA